jgi:4-hydroxybenzoate polyprenyltransferase
MYLGSPSLLHGASVGRDGLLLLGSLALTSHVFLFNDWADYSRDSGDLRRSSLGVNGYGTNRKQIAYAAIVLLVLANVAFALVGTSAVVFGAGIAFLSLVYSFSPRLGKGTPIAASLNHLIGGSLHFLLGYAAVRSVDGRGVGISLFFGLVFAAGHLNQEVRDYESDRANGVGTVAVTIGRTGAFLASFCLFTIAYLLIGVLALVSVLPGILMVSAGAWLFQARWTIQALGRGLDSATALWMQRRYRLLFALVGVVMLIR